MSYQNKPGHFSLFKNETKFEKNHPDYRGQGVDLAGNEVWVSAWLKTGQQTGKRFMSCVMQPKENKVTVKPKNEYREAKDQFPYNDDIPF